MDDPTPKKRQLLRTFIRGNSLIKNRKTLYLREERANMKKLIYSLLLAGLVWSCGNESSQKTVNQQETVKTLDLSLYAPLDLTAYQIPTSLYLPNDEQLVGGAVEPQVIHQEDDFSWTIKASRAFELYIEDFGEKDALELYKENLDRYDDIHNYQIIEDRVII